MSRKKTEGPEKGKKKPEDNAGIILEKLERNTIWLLDNALNPNVDEAMFSRCVESSYVAYAYLKIVSPKEKHFLEFEELEEE